MIPTAEQKKFILKELIPFVLREQGRGFQMATWKTRTHGLKTFFNHDLRRNIKVPKCNTVACIGGSILCLRSELQWEGDAAAAIGLNSYEGTGLFYSWLGNASYRWPSSFQKEYKKAKTPLAKAKVAVKLLRKVAHEGGGFLKAKPEAKK